MAYATHMPKIIIIMKSDIISNTPDNLSSTSEFDKGSRYVTQKANPPQQELSQAGSLKQTRMTRTQVMTRCHNKF